MWFRVLSFTTVGAIIRDIFSKGAVPSHVPPPEGQEGPDTLGILGAEHLERSVEDRVVDLLRIAIFLPSVCDVLKPGFIGYVR